ncbi:hypothetical protein [Nocardioides zeae]|uniref:Mce-associated membrane protein n=1 Tax=Nocardioides zeae TaxID=1457234 RepID=A0AAJ1TZ98_9ACTN|nr:hypothetical protein [Nocardioides zeae]MDQ1105121.1 Mce-associated membrane protein [Nocardioides zeae]
MTLDTRTEQEAEPETVPESDSEADSGTDSGTAAGPASPGGAARTRQRLLAGLPWLVLVVAVVVAALGGRSWWLAEHDDGLHRAAERDAVLVAARTHVATLTTMDSRDVAGGLEAWGAATTGMLHDQMTDVDDGSRGMLGELGTTSVGRVVDAAVLELDGATATVLVSVEVTVTENDDAGTEPTIKRNRFAADLREVDGAWLLENLQQVAVTL